MAISQYVTGPAPRQLGQRARQLELAVLENESGTIQLEAATDD